MMSGENLDLSGWEWGDVDLTRAVSENAARVMFDEIIVELKDCLLIGSDLKASVHIFNKEVAKIDLSEAIFSDADIYIGGPMPHPEDIATCRKFSESLRSLADRISAAADAAERRIGG